VIVLAFGWQKIKAAAIPRAEALNGADHRRTFIKAATVPPAEALNGGG
jgi:hypothetical protein